MTSQDVDIEALISGGGGGRRWWIVAALAAIVAIAAAAYLLLRDGGDSAFVAVAQPVETTLGRLTTTLETTGAAAPVQSAELTFGAGGTVASVAVSAGDTVAAGDVIATLDEEAALRQLESAQISLRQAQLRLDDLLQDPTFAEIASAQQSTLSARSQLLGAQEALAALFEPPATAEIESAVQSVASAEAQLAGAGVNLERLLAPATDVEIATADASVAQANVSATAARQRFDDAAEAALGPFFNQPQQDAAFAALDEAEASLASAEASLASALARRAELDEPPAAQEIVQAEASVASATAALAAARERQGDVGAAPSASAIDQAERSLALAEASLRSAQARESELFAGVDASALEREQLSVRQAELSLETAEATFDGFVIVAPFAGVVASLSIAVGDSVGTNTVAAVLVDPDGLVIDLTVTEGDLLGLAPGQVGIATFDAIDDVEYPVRILSVGSVPSVAQGVVTYPVQAILLGPAEIAEAAADLAVLAGSADGSGLAALAAGGGFGARAGGGGGGTGSGGFGGAGGQLLADVELPPGVTAQDVFAALAAGQPLPAGVVLPEGFEIPQQLLDRVAQGGFGGRPGANAGGGGGDFDGTANRPLPAAGMSASVTVLLEVRPAAVLVSTTAVRQQGAIYFVTVPGPDETTERVDVTVGESDGTSVEIVTGLEVGATVLIGASTDGVAFSAQGQQQQQQQGFAGFGGGGFGGGGRGGGGAPGGGGGGGGGR